MQSQLSTVNCQLSTVNRQPSTLSVLIVAGGKGLRMGGELPKQFLPLADGRPVLMHTIDAFIRYDKNIRIILVLPSSQQEYWKDLCSKHDYKIPHDIADGGETRFHSVKNGLSLINGEGLIGVHDGVRPFVSQEVIAACFEKASQWRAVIPVIPVVETIRKTDGIYNTTVDRNLYKLVQTPQVFDAELLRQAYKQPYSEAFTDDASVVEAVGQQIALVDGNRENIKITTPFDLKIANALLECTI